jgi:diguanylate cyclase (GGDEF)-like protein/PAS domain S-box-containing protein
MSELLERSTRQHDAILALSSASELPWHARLKKLLEVDSQTIECARVSYWRLIRGGKAIRCESLYRADARKFEEGLVLDALEFPRYFEALRSEQLVVAEDAHTDPSTAEFTRSYLEPSGIGAMLDVPVFVRGTLVGVLCHEHVGGKRPWLADERHFAVSIGQLVSLAIESEERHRLEQRFRAIAEVSPVPLIVNTMPDGRCLWGNTAMSRLSGVPRDELAGQVAETFYVDPGERAEVMAELRTRGFVEARDVRFKRRDDTIWWGRISLRPFAFEDEPAVIVAITDVTEQKRLEDILRHAALHDALTRLPNRVSLFDAIRREIGRARRDEEYRFALLYLDLDGFKAVNDEHGHDAGDRMLTSFADCLRASLRPMDLAARVGGDEFAAIVADVGDEAEAAAVAKRIEEAAAALPSPVRVSIGIALADAKTADPDDVMRRADTAMYATKQSRRHA